MIDDLLKTNGAMLDRVSIIDNGLPVVEVPLLNYSMTAEAARFPRRQIEMTVDATEAWIPTHYYDPMHPQAELVFLAEKGIYDPLTGTEYWFPLGTFMVDSTTIRRDPAGMTMTVKAPDKSARRGWPLLGAIAVAYGTKAEDVMATVLKSTKTPVELVTQNTGFFYASTLVGQFGEPPMQLAQKIAAQIGWELYYDVLGVLQMQKLQDPAITTPKHVWDVDMGAAVYDIERTISADTIIDGVILQWSGGITYYPDNQVKRPVVWEGDAALITNATQATQAAKAYLLRRQLGESSPLYTVWSDPRVEINDIARVVDSATGTYYQGRITAMTYAANTPTMQVQLSNLAGETNV